MPRCAGKKPGSLGAGTGDGARAAEGRAGGRGVWAGGAGGRGAGLMGGRTEKAAPAPARPAAPPEPLGAGPA